MDAAEVLAEALAYLPDLHHLNLRSTAHRAVACTVHCTPIAHILVPGNRLHPRGITRIAKALQACHKLQHLNLSCMLRLCPPLTL